MDAKKPMNTSFTFPLHVDDHKRLKDIAWRERVSMAEFVRRAVAERIERIDSEGGEDEALR